MPLAAGTRLGPYEVGAPLGAGGMGEVYRATDSKLGRDVAIKILPESVARDPDRRARFEREARTVASLNHPSPRDPVEWLFYDVLGSACFNAGQFQEGLNAGRRLVALWPDYYFGHLWCAMNAVALGQFDVAQRSIAEARRLVPDVSVAMVRRVLGAMGPDVDRRMMGALQQAGLD